jgi:FAD/FMN-containing dehydrogenase
MAKSSVEQETATAAEAAAGTAEVRNWEGSLASHPRAVVAARGVEDVVAVVRDPDRYPSPVRARGSGHSTTLCGEAEGGTVVDVRGLDRILSIGPDTVTTEPGALYLDVARELEKHDLQFYVNIELGNLTMGAAACCATKDASFPGEYGQVNSYCVGMKVVTPSGDVLEIGEDDPELLQAARSAYGLLGVVVEVTFRVRPLQAMAVEHRAYRVEEFLEALPELKALDRSLMLYLFPYLDKVLVELRRYVGDEAEARRAGRPNRLLWKVRNTTWKSVAPGIGALTERLVPSRRARYFVVDRTNELYHFTMGRILSSGHTIPTDQTIRYPGRSGWNRYTFSIWAFPEERYPEVLPAYFAWAKRYYADNGWRPNLLHVGYRIARDESSLFSYTHEGTAITIDPVSTGATGWRQFLMGYNAFCSEHGGSPLFNQTWGITAEQARRAFGERLDRFERIRGEHDPDERFLNAYFRQYLRRPAAPRP